MASQRRPRDLPREGWEGKDGKVISYRKLYYPPIAFTVPVGGDQATTNSGPKRLWAGDGILEHAKAALKAR